MHKTEMVTVPRIEALFDRLDSAGALLTPGLAGSEGNSYGYSQEIEIEGARFVKHHVITRLLRKDNDLMVNLGIRNPKAKVYYEYDPSPESSFIFYIDEYTHQNYLSGDNKKKATRTGIYKYSDNNPKGELMPVKLCSKNGSPQAFFVTANWAPFSAYHFIVLAENDRNRALKQVYHPGCTLWWIDDLFEQLNSADYNLFFSPQGAGNSLDTLHFQIIKGPSFPCFERLGQKYPQKEPGLIDTKKGDWPFKGILARYSPETKDRVLSALEEKILLWLKSSPDNTFCLLYQLNQDGCREVFFVFRKRGLNSIKGISNYISGYEVAGNLIIEDRTEYLDFPEISEKLELMEQKE